MASYRAVETTTSALVALLRMNYRPEDFGGQHIQFAPYVATDFADPMASGVSVYLFRITPNGSHRIPAGRRMPDGERRRTKLPLDMHYLMTVWAPDAATEHRIAGWMMRTYEDTSILPHALLKAAASNVFGPDETVELVLGDLLNEDLFRIWETITTEEYRLSIPYIARNVRIESQATVQEYGPAQERLFDYRPL